jgi:hypothetical protein
VEKKANKLKRTQESRSNAENSHLEITAEPELEFKAEPNHNTIISRDTNEVFNFD